MDQRDARSCAAGSTRSSTASSAALRERHGFESSRLNEFLARRHARGRRALARRSSASPSIASRTSRRATTYRELLEELERLRALEQFLQREGRRFRGPRSGRLRDGASRCASASKRSSSSRAISREGNFESISPEQLRELLSEQAARSFVILRDLESTLRRAGYLRGPTATR